MGPLRILVANEPRSFRETFAAVFRELRPEAEVREALPADLDGEVERFGPDLVFCSGVTPSVERSVPAWVNLYPPDKPVAMIYTAGELSTLADVDLDMMLSVIDRTRELLEGPDRPPTGPGGPSPERASERRGDGPGVEGGTDAPARHGPFVRCGLGPGVKDWGF